MNGLSNGNSFGMSNGQDIRPALDWSLLSVPPWKFGLRQSDDRRGM